MRVMTFLAVLGIATASSAMPAAATIGDPFPACTSERVLKKLVSRFNQTERIYWSHRGKALESIANPHRHAVNPFADSPVNRRYCHGDAVFADGKKRRVHYLIEQGAGFAGFGWNVEYCIHGLDPWKYHDGRCRVLSRR